MRLAQQSCRTTGTEFPLTRTHADTCAAAQVYQVVHIKFVHGIVHFTYGHILTFANQAVIVRFPMQSGSPFHRDGLPKKRLGCSATTCLPPERSSSMREPGRGSFNCNARLVDAKLLLQASVCGPLRHQPVCHQFSARDSYESRNTVAHFVIQQHDAAADVTAGRGHYRQPPAGERRRMHAKYGL